MVNILFFLLFILLDIKIAPDSLGLELSKKIIDDYKSRMLQEIDWDWMVANVLTNTVSLKNMFFIP